MKRTQILSTNRVNRFVNAMKKISGSSEGTNRQKVIVVDKLEQLANWRRENGEIYCTISIIVFPILHVMECSLFH